MSYEIEKTRTAPTKGSIFDVANRRGQKPEAILAEADVCVVFDDSSSMDIRLAAGADEVPQTDEWGYPTFGGKTRHEVATDALRQIQESYEGRVVLIEFNSIARMQLGGVPSPPQGSTNLAAGLEMAKDFDDTDMRIICISDGEPDSADAALRIAETFTTKIDTIFIGDDNAERSLAFMKQLAAVTGGTAHGKVSPDMLGDKVVHLIGDGK